MTCFYVILDPKSGCLLYANAGHDLPYLRRRSGVAEELRARGMPLGLMPGMSYEQKEIMLDAGEAALFYSDGLVEAHDPQGEMFGFPRLPCTAAARPPARRRAPRRTPAPRCSDTPGPPSKLGNEPAPFL